MPLRRAGGDPAVGSLASRAAYRPLRSPRMGLFRRRSHSDTAVADRVDDVPGDLAGQLEEIERLTAENRAKPDRATERRLLRVRHAAGIQLLDAAGGGGAYPEPDTAALPAGTLPDIARADLT